MLLVFGTSQHLRESELHRRPMEGSGAREEPQALQFARVRGPRDCLAESECRGQTRPAV